MIYNKLTINGSEYTDYDNLEITKTISDANANSSFIANFDSPFGRHKSDFNVGDNFVIYADKDNLIRSAGSPIAQWKLNEGDGLITYDTFNVNNGSIYSGTWVTGKVGSAINFAGSGYIKMPADNSLSIGSTDATICAWIYPSGTLRDSHAIISKYDTSVGREFYLYISSGTTWNNLSFNGFRYPWINFSGLTTFSAGSVRKDTWSHVAITFQNGSWLEMYINGIKKGSSFTSGIGYSSGTTPYIGGVVNSSSSPDHQFTGTIDDVRVYNFALTPVQINEIYNLGSGIETITNENQKFFNGLIESKTFEGEENTQRLILRGKDYTSRLMDMTVQPKVYSNTEISLIVKDILSSNLVPDITTNNVQTTEVTLARISFNHETIFDAFSQLALLCGYYFYIDNDKDLHFKPKKSSDSEVTFDNTNILTTNFDQSRTGMYNRVWVYGDTYFSEYKEPITAGSPNGGSVIILSYKPHNVSVVSSGVTLQPGGVYEYGVPASGLKYLVNYDDRQIIFLSGTNYGSNIPISGNNVVITYDRSIPIAKYGQNDTSKKLYGSKDLVIRDKNIKDPQTAIDILKAKLNDVNPLNRVDCEIKGFYQIDPGQTVNMQLSDFGIDEDQITVIEQKFNFNKRNCLSENISTFTLSKKFVDITDQIKDMKDRIKNLENTYFQQGDIITRLVTDIEDFNIVGSHYNVFYRGIGSAFILNHPVNGLLGSYASHSFGDWRTGSTLLFSGGNNYAVTGSYDPENPETGGLGIMIFG